MVPEGLRGGCAWCCCWEPLSDDGDGLEMMVVVAEQEVEIVN